MTNLTDIANLIDLLTRAQDIIILTLYGYLAIFINIVVFNKKITNATQKNNKSVFEYIIVFLIILFIVLIFLFSFLESKKSDRLHDLSKEVKSAYLKDAASDVALKSKLREFNKYQLDYNNIAHLFSNCLYVESARMAFDRGCTPLGMLYTKSIVNSKNFDDLADYSKTQANSAIASIPTDLAIATFEGKFKISEAAAQLNGFDASVKASFETKLVAMVADHARSVDSKPTSILGLKKLTIFVKQIENNCAGLSEDTCSEIKAIFLNEPNIQIPDQKSLDAGLRKALAL